MILKLKKIKINKWLILILIALAVLPTIFGLIGSGFYSLHDDMHVAWLYQMDRALKDGQFPPRWAPDLSFNFGYPLFNFVYPLPFYLAEVFYISGLSLVGSIKIVFALSLVLSGLAMFLFLKRNFSNFFSFLGAVVYVYTPYRAVNVYVRGAIGEALSFVFIPLVAWAEDKLVKQGGKKNIVLTSICFAGLILSHNIAFLMTIPFLLFYGLILILSLKKKKQAFFNLVLGFVLGLAISSFFWVPAFWERRFMVADTVFNFQDHFPFIKQLILPSWGYGISIWGPNDGLSFQIGIVNLLALVIAFISFTWLLAKNKLKSRELVLFIWGFLSLMVVLFLMNIRSVFIWEKIALLPYFQFPWRFLILTTFLTAFLVATIEKISLSLKLKRFFGVGLLFLAIILSFNYFKPEKILPERTDNYFMNRYFANKKIKGYSDEISQEYLTIKEEYLRLPLWTSVRPETLPQAKIESEEGEIIFSEEKATYFTAKIKTPVETRVTFYSYYYPGWEAFVDGQKVKIGISEPHGQISIEVPEGEHQLIFKFGETRLRSITNFVSLFSLLTVLGFVSIKGRPRFLSIKRKKGIC
jgi:hypothetical protein